MSSIANKIGGILKMLRTKRGLTQAQLAERAGVSTAYLSLIERNARTPNLEVLEQISSGLDVPINIVLLFASDLSELENFDKSIAERLSLIAMRLIESDKDNESSPLPV